jgi:hypothetical protein
LAPESEVQEAERINAPILEEIRRLESNLEAKAKPLREQLLDEKLAAFPGRSKKGFAEGRRDSHGEAFSYGAILG